MALVSVLRELIGEGNDGDGTTRQAGSQTNGREKGTGKSLLEVIRLMVEMEPAERIALIRLLKAFG